MRSSIGCRLSATPWAASSISRPSPTRALGRREAFLGRAGTSARGIPGSEALRRDTSFACSASLSDASREAQTRASAGEARAGARRSADHEASRGAAQNLRQRRGRLLAERELRFELHYSGVSRRGLFSKAIRLGLYTCILYVCIYIRIYIYIRIPSMSIR